ncbi:MAG: hypothetical protein HYW07_17325 [Candidatus Latescibacteria bacterium]|nr:hypothetical protein [Candidatus Latescibacterota bacterium]
MEEYKTRLLSGKALLLLGLGASAAFAQEGYRLLPDRVVVNSAAHWQAWSAPEGSRVLLPEGGVEPRLVRRQINAALDAGQFRYVSEGDTLSGGVRAAGSNLQAGGLAMDGDLATYWEPDPQSPLESWWLELDLGRAVIAQHIRVRFVEEGGGDPFLKFRVLISDGRIALTEARNREFFRVGLVTEPNKDQREFEFEVQPQHPAPLGSTGEVAQILRFEALGSDGVRGREVASGEYALLDSIDQGAIDYFRRTGAGRQIQVEKEIYEALPAQEQGQVRYFRRERPRLAEVEVYTSGDEVTRLTRSLPKAGVVRIANTRRTREVEDGIFSTFRSLREYDPIKNENQIEVDLGTRYWLDRVLLLSPGQPPPAYQVRICDGSVDPSGEKIWRAFEERQNREVFLRLEETFPLQEVRFVEVRRLKLEVGKREGGNLSEVQVYGEGYASEVVMVSPLIRLGRHRLLSTLSWNGDIPLGTRVEVRTRSGDELLHIPHYFNQQGVEIDVRTWEKIAEAERPPVVIEDQPGADWSNWSPSYLQPGEEFKSPNPRQYLMAEVRLLSQEPLRAARLRQLQLHFDPPLVDQALAELWPTTGIKPGEEQEFTLYLQPLFTGANPGFDRLELRSSSSAPIELVSVFAGQNERLLRPRRLWPGTLQVESGQAGALSLVFPQLAGRQDLLYAIHFRTRVFLSNTLFGVRLIRSARPGVVQEAAAGEATSLVESQSLVARADLQEITPLGQVQLIPPVFTPNGDGVNDQVAIEIPVFVLEGPKRIAAQIYDLAGRQVRDLSVEASQASGLHRLLWDGRDHQGMLQPPGLYLIRAGIDTDAARSHTQVLSMVGVVY